MPQTASLMLPVPRVLRATKRRVRGDAPEPLAVLDAVPVLVAAPGPGEAPVALGTAEGEVRSFGGALYRPLFQVFGEGCTPDDLATVLKARADRTMATDWQKAQSFGRFDRYAKEGERVVDLAGTYRGAKRDRGLRSVEGHQVRDVFDDGRAAQRAMAEATAANLALIDGRLWHRCPAPVYYVSQHMSQHQGYVTDAYAAVPNLVHAQEERRLPSERDGAYDDAPWLVFAADEGEKIAAFCEVLAERAEHPPGAVLRGGVRGIEVVDAAALHAASPPRTAAEVLRDSAVAFLRQSGHDLAGQPDATLAAYMEARAAAASLARGSDADAAYARIRPYLAICEARFTGVLGILREDDEFEFQAFHRASDGLGAVRGLMLRHERFESPRPDLYAGLGDEAELSSLAM